MLTALCVTAKSQQCFVLTFQGVSSDDVCLKPHGAAASRTPSRGDSAVDAALDKAITPVLLQQQQHQIPPSATAGPWYDSATRVHHLALDRLSYLRYYSSSSSSRYLQVPLQGHGMTLRLVCII